MGGGHLIADTNAVEENLEDHINIIRKILKENVLDCLSPPVYSYKEEEGEILKLLRRLIENGESNSVLLIGPRGSGKSTLVNNAMVKLKESHEAFNDCVVVRLNGYLHTNDHMALKAIAVQMQLENSVGDKVFGSFAENLTFLLQCLGKGNRLSSKSVIFILDEFDLFCHHHNQTLLYNLFDVAQSAQAPLCVLGISCRFDVVELFEKRVLSRFSNRKIFLHPFADCSDAQIVSRRLQLLEHLLSVPEKCAVKYKLSSHLAASWNKSLKSLSENSVVKNCMKSLCEFSYCERVFRNFLFAVVSKLGHDHTALLPTDFSEVHTKMRKNSKVSLMEGLSVLELCLIISMMHHTQIYDDSPFNFELIFSRLLKFDRYNSNILNIERDVALKAFEHLRGIELLLPTSSNQVSKEFQMFRLEVSPDEVQETVNNNAKTLPYVVVQWAMSDLI